MSESHLQPSELIINPDGSIYHLNLKPGEIADTIITVGDPDRVTDITQHFDSIEVDVHRREFKTQTGMYKDKRLTVISTGIGTDNIDIVFNELDALVNINFETRTIKPEHHQLSFIRVGTSGAIQADIPINSFLVSERAIGFDSLLHFYESAHILDVKISEEIVSHLNLKKSKGLPYVVSSHPDLFNRFAAQEGFITGTTVTNVGFYGPQSRSLRLPLSDPSMAQKLQSFEYEKAGKKSRITNLEMETSGIYGMAQLLGHKAVSLNAILANRANGTFSKNPKKIVEVLIKKTLDLLTI